MNKIAFISDIHGNWPALDAVLKDIDRRKIDTVICLGDVVGYYSMINEVIETIRSRGITTVMGNHDHAMVKSNGIIARSKTCTNVLKRQLTFITASNFEFVRQLPVQYDLENGQHSFCCVHGGLNDSIDEYLFEADEGYFRAHKFKYDTLVTGHTHRFINKRAGAFRHLNPGSVGQPRDNDNRASYMVTDGVEAVQVRVDYDIDRIAADMKRMGFKEYIYKALYTGVHVSATTHDTMTS